MRTLLKFSAFIVLIITSGAVDGKSFFEVNHDERDDRCELKGFLGVTHEEAHGDKVASLGLETKGGTIVTNVIGCTAALNAGIQPMDYLYAVNGKTTSASTGFFCLASEFEIGETFEVGLFRKGKKKVVQVTLGRRSDACQENTPFPKLGFFGINNVEGGRQPGVLLDVSSSGPVAQLGLEDGDRLLRINGYNIADWSDLSVVKRLITDVDNVTFELIRDGKGLSISGAIPEAQHNYDQWRQNRSVLADCADEIEQAFDEIEDAIDEIDFNQIEREIESAIRSSDIREETEDAITDVMEAVREVFSGVRTRRAGANEDDELRTPNIDPSDMDARVENMDERDFSRVESFDVDMPRNRDLKVNNFSASPNPNEGRFKLSFELPSKGDTRIAIYSSTGREVYAFDLGSYTGTFTDELDIMQNGPGTYYLVVRQADQAFVKKLVLIKR